MTANTYKIKLHTLAKDPYDVLHRMIPADPSRKDSPMVNQFAKPIPLV
jgi:hypothetical protein